MADDFPLNDYELQIKALKTRNEELTTELMHTLANMVSAQEKILRLEARVEDVTDMNWLKDDPNDEKPKLLREARKEARRLKMLIKIHQLHTHHNLCFMNDLTLWREAFNDLDIRYPHDTIPPEQEFELGCEAWCKPYYRSRTKCQGNLPVGKPPALPGYEDSK